MAAAGVEAAADGPGAGAGGGAVTAALGRFGMRTGGPARPKEWEGGWGTQAGVGQKRRAEG